MPYYYLEIIRGIEQGRRFALSDGAVSIGRGASNSICIHNAEKTVSGHHAIVYKSGDRFVLQDMQSTNGSFVDDSQVTECDIRPGSVVGFGQNGPRLKLIASDNALSTDFTPQSLPGTPDTRGKTIEDMNEDDSPSLPRPNRRENPPVNSRETSGRDTSEDTPRRRPRRPDTSPLSQTLEMEQRLVDKQFNANDMHALMKDGKRLEKILDRGKLGSTQSNLLASVYSMHQKTSNQWKCILGGVILVSVIILSFFGVRHYQYTRMLQRGLSLEQKLDGYEQRIEAAQGNPRQLQELLAEFDSLGRMLSAVKGTLDESDIGKFYADSIERDIDHILMRFGETNYHIPPTMVERVKYHLAVYSGRMKSSISRYMQRKPLYFPMIHRIFREKKLPAELAYIAMLESGLNPKAVSHAGARGLWQFMGRTGRHYGLRISGSVDERLDPEKATYAAAEYFKDLIGIFGGESSVMLAMAGYNAGENRIMGALRKIDDPMRNRDFWYIYRMGYLAEETNEYIPRVIALMIISENPGRFGFSVSEESALATEEINF